METQSITPSPESESCGESAAAALSPAATRGQRTAFAVIFMIVLIDMVGLSILIPVQAYIARQYSTAALTVTLFTVIYSGAQFVAAPVLGWLSDRYGRRPILLISVLGSAAGYVLFGIGGALWVLYLSRLIDGITAGNISTASAYVADVTPPARRAQNFALIGIAFGLGFILGPALGGALSQISLAAPAYAAAIFALVAAAASAFLLPESLPASKRSRTPLRWRDANAFATILEFGRRPGLGRLLTVQSLFFFVFNGINSLATVFVIDRFGVTPGQIALLFVAGGLANALVQGGLVGPLVARVGEQRLVMASLALQAAGLVGMVLAPAFGWLYPIVVLGNGGAGLIWPAIGALIANRVPAHEQGRIAGVSAALGSLMSVLGPLWAGLLYDGFSPLVLYLAGAVVFLLAGWIMAPVRPAPPTQNSAQNVV